MELNRSNEEKNARRTRKRMPDKTLYALQDITDELVLARRAWNRANEWAERRYDTVVLLELAKLRRALDTIERKASDALAGKYTDD